MKIICALSLFLTLISSNPMKEPLVKFVEIPNLASNIVVQQEYTERKPIVEVDFDVVLKNLKTTRNYIH